MNKKTQTNKPLSLDNQNLYVQKLARMNSYNADNSLAVIGDKKLENIKTKRNNFYKNSLLTLVIALSTFLSSVQSHAATRSNNKTATNQSSQSSMPAKLLLEDWASTKIPIRIIHKNSTFENIFYNNFSKELEQESERQKNLDKLNIEEFSIIKYNSNLPSAQINEAIEIGVADISLVSLDSYTQAESDDVVSYLEYPFMFSNTNQVQSKFFSASALTFSQLNARSVHAMPVAVIPYAYKIFATQKKDLTAQDILSDPITIENNIISKKMFSFKRKEQVIINNAVQEPKTQTIETTAMELMERQYYKNYRQIYLTNHSLKSSVLVVGKNWWAALSAQQKDIVIQALTRSVQKSIEDSFNFSTIALGTLENQNSIVTKKVDYQKDFAALFQALSAMHSEAIKTQKILPFYQTIQSK